ncbi:MAG: SusD/RagB family nutrient-binding outer membrane lipoprotein [Muribaculaceae bacterium]|nr:SusD/RagB family nutrient-binding outer membrane lipoprotein [Muribaculaceae bacterium]
MKVFNKLIMGVAAMGMLSLMSCNDWLDVNENPNSPTNTQTEYQTRLPWCQFYLNSAYQFAGSRSIYACGWLTQTSRVNRDGCSAQWEPTASLTTTAYQWFFVGSAANYPDLYRQAEAAGAYHYMAAEKFMHAYGYMLMTDLHGEMPYTAALGAVDSPSPAYDTGKTIFLGCLNEIDEAIELFQKTQEEGAMPLSAGDSWAGGDVSKWLKMCYLMKARWINHLSKKAKGSYKEGKYDEAEILACLDKAQQSNADNVWINHNDNGGATHDVLGWDEPVDYAPLFSVQGMNNTIRATKQMVDNLENFAGSGVEDPRADKLLPWCRSRKSADSPAELTWSADGKWRRSLGVDMHTTVRQQGAPYAMSWNNATSSWYCNTTNTERQNDTVYVVWKSGAKGYYATVDLLNRWNKSNNNSATTAMFYNRPSSPGYIAMYHEACFIRAEVLFNQGKKAEAYDWYKKGVQASIEAMNAKCNTWCTEDASLADCPAFAPMDQAKIDNFLNNGIGTAGDLTLGKIMTQKQIAMFYSGELWNDMRRYDYDSNIFLNWQIPAEYYTNAAALRAIPQGKMWRRWAQCSHEQNYNVTQLQAIGSQVPGAVMQDGDGNPVTWFKHDAVWSIPVWWDSTQE